MNRVAVLVERSKTQIHHRELPIPSNDEVLVKVESVGICGSDIHYYTEGHIGDRYVTYPHVQGHECAGTIIQVGSLVTNFSVGDRVVLEPSIACGVCEYCKKGTYNLCEHVVFLSTPPHEGLFKEYVTHPSRWTYKLPDAVDFDVGTLVEPLAVALHAFKRGRVSPGAKVLITGMGPIGMMLAVVSDYYNLDEVWGTDLNSRRLEIGMSIGLTHEINPQQEELPSDYFDFVIDTTGVEFVLNQAIMTLKRGGKLISVGFARGSGTSLNLTKMLQKEIDLLSVYRYANDYSLGIKVLEKKQKQLKKVIAKNYSLEEMNEAMEFAADIQNCLGKVIITP